MKLETESDATEWLYGAKALAVVSAWSALGAFERMRGGPVAPSDLGIEPRALAITLPVLKHLGLVAGDTDRVVLTAAAQRLLASGEMPTARNLDTFADLAKMKTVLLEGGPVRDDAGKSKGTTGGTVASDPERTARFLDTLYRGSESPAASVFAWLSPYLPKGGAVLDLGGGHGRYGRLFADAGFSTTLLDLPEIVAYAKARHGGELSYLEGNFHELADLGGPYDLVFLSNIVHGESFEQNEALIARVARSLRPGGLVAIKDMFLDEMGTDPKNAVFFGLTMLFYTSQGQSPSFRGARDWLAKAGLLGPELALLDTQTLLIGRKPASA